MKKMRLGKARESRNTSQKSIFECEKDLRNQAIELAKKHKDKKPTKYLLK